ncbi:hypothetical protein WA158_003222 [Blastocystis sp. Blastoise]
MTMSNISISESSSECGGFIYPKGLCPYRTAGQYDESQKDAVLVDNKPTNYCFVEKQKRIPRSHLKRNDFFSRLSSSIDCSSKRCTQYIIRRLKNILILILMAIQLFNSIMAIDYLDI